MKYMGASQFKAFMACEAAGLAEARGEYKESKTTALLMGSYVDSYFEGSLDQFKADNPELFTKSQELKADYKHAERIIERIERDPMFMRYMSGDKQVIRTGEIEGVPVKIKIDSFHPGKALVDLKIMKDFEDIWMDGLKVSFIEAWGYDIQGAIYQTVEGSRLPFFIAGATKEKEPDIELFNIPQPRIDYCLNIVRANIQRFDAIKRGIVEPNRCGSCNYCRSTKVLTGPVDYTTL